MTTKPITLQGRYYRNYPSGDPLGSTTESINLAIDETTFLLIDVYGQQHDESFGENDALAAFYRSTDDGKHARIIHERIAPAKAAAKRAGLNVAYLTNYLSPGLSQGTEWRNMSMRTCGVDVLEAWQPPTPILEHMSVIAPEADEPLIRKQFYSGFFETHLDSLLRGWNTRNLVVVGFDSQVCLRTTVVDAMYRNYRVVVLRDGIRTSEYPETESTGMANFMAVRFIESSVGYTATVDEFVEACASVGAAGGNAKSATA